MSLTDISVGSNAYVAYASVAEADTALAVDPVRMAAWAVLSDDSKGINLVASTRRLDLLSWAGSKTAGTAQDNAWPRTGLVYADSTAVPDNVIPRDLERATILLAGSIASTPAQANAGTSGRAISRVKAGSAEVEFFRQQETITGKPIQDETAFELIRRWLKGRSGSAATGALASGTDGESPVRGREPLWTNGGLCMSVRWQVK